MVQQRNTFKGKKHKKEKWRKYPLMKNRKQIEGEENRIVMRKVRT